MEEGQTITIVAEVLMMMIIHHAHVEMTKIMVQVRQHAEKKEGKDKTAFLFGFVMSNKIPLWRDFVN